MKKKRQPENTREIHDTIAESLIREDEIIQTINKTIGIEVITVIYGEYLRKACIKPRGERNPRNWVRINIAECTTSADVVKAVRSLLQKLVQRPMYFEVTSRCDQDLTKEAMGSDETDGKYDDKLLWELARRYEGDYELIHAWYPVTKAMEYPDPQTLEGDLRRALNIEVTIYDRILNDNPMIAYWWRLDNSRGNELHVVYEGNDEDNPTESNEELIAYAVLREELYQVLQEENLSDEVLITEESDNRNGAILTSTSRQRKYDSPFGPDVPELTTSMNGLIIDDLSLKTFINQLKDYLTELRNPEEPGMTIVIGDYAYDDNSEDGDYKDAQSIRWKLGCYTRLPDTEEVDDEIESKKWRIIDALIHDAMTSNATLKNIINNVYYVDEFTEGTEIKTVTIEWSLDREASINDELSRQWIDALESAYQKCGPTTGIDIAILQYNVAVEDPDIVILKIGIASIEIQE